MKQYDKPLMSFLLFGGEGPLRLTGSVNLKTCLPVYLNDMDKKLLSSFLLVCIVLERFGMDSVIAHEEDVVCSIGVDNKSSH